MAEINKIPRIKKKYEIKDANIKEQLQTDLAEIKNKLSMTEPNSSLFLLKAMFELLLGLSESAIESSKQVLIINEASFMGWYFLGCAYLDENKISYAKTAYENALKNSSTDEIDDTLVKDIFDSLKLIAILENNQEAK